LIEFQGSSQHAQVYVNGQEVSRHLGGYNGFSYDITPNVRAGDNVVAARLNNNWNAQLAPRVGDHTFSGGLYRSANVAVTHPLHVTWYGTFVTTPTLAATPGASSTVNIKTEIRNDRSDGVHCALRTDIVDANGTVVASVSSSQAIASGATVTFGQATSSVDKPSLWHPDHPTLYYTIAVSSGGKSWTTVVGQSHTAGTAETQRATGDFGSDIQYVRVSFVGMPSGQPAGLAEVVFGGS
jgi:beta-galactosidase